MALFKFKKFRKRVKKARKRSFKKSIKKILTSNATSHQIGLGAATGAFFSIIPTFGIGMIIALFIAWKKKLNFLATFLGTLIVNPINGPFVYLLDYQIGSLILGNSNSVNEITISTIRDIAAQVYLGGFILAAAGAIVTYFIAYLIVFTFRRNNNNNKKKKG